MNADQGRAIQQVDTGWTVTLIEADPETPPWIPRTPIAATVPGCVHTDLLAAGHIADPFHARVEHELRWIGRSRWRYETIFRASPTPGTCTELAFDGIDTVAAIELNGSPLGVTSNQHRRYRFDVTARLRNGENSLVVVFDGPVSAVGQAEETHGSYPHANHHPYNQIRKSACNFGWDWGPDVATVGLWRPVRLETWRTARLDQVRPHVTVIDTNTGHVEVDLSVVRHGTNAELWAEMCIGGYIAKTFLAPDSDTATLMLDVPDIELWWPHTLGEQHCYDLTIDLGYGTTRLDQVRRRIGFRTIDLDLVPDGHGTPFRMAINGVAMWVRGANWIPDDAFFSRVPTEDYRRRVQQATAASIDVLRVWGGGIYEADDFYDACDGLGVLVWQDFLFSCAAYPEHSDLASEVEAEARDNIERLMAHPSLALWNGNNENLWGHEDWDWKEPLAGRAWGAGYYFDLLPGLTSELDPTRIYWPGSPYSGSRHVHPNEPAHGVTHIWDVWNTHDYLHYRTYRPRFVSEFGFQAPPTYRILRDTVDAATLSLDDPDLANHQKARGGMAKLQRSLDEHMPEPIDIDDWHYLTQVNQARAVRTGIEWFRSLDECDGAVVWQLNDCWPAISWAAIDSQQRCKPMWYALRAAFDDWLVTIQPNAKGSPTVVLHNISHDIWTPTIVMRRVSLAGKTVADATAHASCPPGTRVRIPIPGTVAATESPTTQLLIVDADDRRTIWGWVPDRDLDYLPGSVHVDVSTELSGVEVEVTAHTLVRDLCLFPDRIDPSASVSDMLTTLLPGESRRFYIEGLNDAHANAIRHRPALRFMNDRHGE